MSRERLVMAYDEHGHLVPTPESEVVMIPVMPEARDHNGKRIASKDGSRPVTPSLARSFMCADLGDEVPTKLLSVEKQDGRAQEWPPYLHVRVEFEKPLRGSPWGSKRSSVCVFSEDDARDPYFAKLSAEDRATILSALHEH